MGLNVSKQITLHCLKPLREGELLLLQSSLLLTHSVLPDSATPGTAARQAPLSMGFPRQEYWSGVPFFLQGIFLTQESNLSSISKGTP